MAPCTRQARRLNHTPSGLKNTSLGDSTHASIVDQMGVEAIEAQPAVNPTPPQTNSTSNTTICQIIIG